MITSKIIRIVKMCFKIQSKFSASINQLSFAVALWHFRLIKNLPQTIFISFFLQFKQLLLFKIFCNFSAEINNTGKTYI